MRNTIGWSQAELARKAGVTSAAISAIEKGGTMPSLAMLIKLAEAFNVPLLDLIAERSDTSDDEAKAFFRKFKDLHSLDEADQLAIQAVVKRLREAKKH